MNQPVQLPLGLVSWGFSEPGIISVVPGAG